MRESNKCSFNSMTGEEDNYISTPRSATCSYGGNTGKRMLSSPPNPQSNTYPSSGQTGKKMLIS